MSANNITVQMDHPARPGVLLARTTIPERNRAWNRNPFNDNLHIPYDSNFGPKFLLFNNAVLRTFSATKK